MGKYENAIKCYNKVIDLNPSDVDALFNRGLAYYSLGKYNESLECWNVIVKNNPLEANAWHCRFEITGKNFIP